MNLSEGTPERLVLLGAGNVATHLGRALVASASSAVRLTQIYSPGGRSARALAEELGERISAVGSLEELDLDADWYIFAVPDDALIPLAKELAGQVRGLWVHTSGSTSLEDLAEVHRPAGVLYPLQTFSKGKVLDFSEVPLYVEGTDSEAEGRILRLGELLSRSVARATSQQRLVLHLGAVFACNFSNHLIAVAEELLTRHGLPEKALLPLIDEMTAKLHTLPAREAQTGPARRGDERTLRRHERFLASEPELEHLYSLLSRQIRERSERG